MAKAVRFASYANALLGVLALGACAHPARELPPDMSAVAPAQRLLPGDAERPEYRLSCADLGHELGRTREAIAAIESELRMTQTDNQSKGVAGILIFTPIMLAMDENAPLKTRYRELDEHRERVLRIAQARQCPA